MNLVYDDPGNLRRYERQIEGGLTNDGALALGTADQVHEFVVDSLRQELARHPGKTDPSQSEIDAALRWTTVDGSHEPIKKILDSPRA
jgi:hypothetical protein